MNGALGLIPVIGGAAKSIASGFEEFLPHLAQNNPKPVGITPDEQNSWNDYMAAISTQIGAARTTICKISADVTMSNALFSQVTDGGPWCVEDPSSATYRPPYDEVWSTVQPYYNAKIAMQGMEAQSIFLMSVPVSVIDANTACTQSIADKFAGYFTGFAPSVAWCDDDQVLIPIVGYTMDVYTTWPERRCFLYTKKEIEKPWRSLLVGVLDCSLHPVSKVCLRI